MRAFVEQELAKVKAVYLKAPERIISDYNNEKEKVSEYKGRELLEMLQNADDESDSAQDRVAHIELKDGFLTIANNGNPFSRDGVTSLMYSYLSPKYKRQNKIGSKGTGFRSILSWAKEIFIRSYDLSIEFSNENARSFLQDLIAEDWKIENVLADKSPAAHPIAILLTPKWKDIDGDTFDAFDTRIIIKLQEAVEEDVQSQINSLDKEVLLFLNNLERIVIDSPKRMEVIKKIPGSNGQAIIRIESFSGDTIEEKAWFVHAKSGNYQEKNYELKVAYAHALDDHKNILYSFFKTDVKFPFPAVVHGTFELSGNRNQLNRSETNKFLLGELAQLLIDVAINMADQSGEPSWQPLKLLSFDTSFDQAVTDLGFQESLLEKIKSNKLFPTVSGSYIAHDDKPIGYNRDYGALLPPQQFKHLTVHTEDERVKRLLQDIKLWIYKADWFFGKLSSISHTLTLEKRAKLIAYLLQDYGEPLRTSPKEGLPTLFVDEADTVIPSGVEVVLPPEQETFTIPVYIQLRFLNETLFQLLLTELAVKGSRALADKLSVFDVQEYSFATVLRRIVAQTKEQIEKNKSKKHKYIRALTAFLWQVFAAPDRMESIPLTIDIPLLNRFETMGSASRLYLGKEYSADTTESLLKKVNKKLFVGSPKLLGLEKQTMPRVKEFLIWLGVAEYPRLTAKTFSQSTQKDYAYFVYHQLTYPKKIKDLTFASANELCGSSDGFGTKIIVEMAEHIEQILEKASPEDILLWLLKDPAVNYMITNKSERSSSSNFAISLRSKQHTRSLYGQDIYPYLLWVLRTTKWIRAKSGERVKPTVCCFSKTVGPDFSPLIEVPDIAYGDKRFAKAKISQEDIDHFFTAIGAASDLAKFTTETIYSMLLKLPELDEMGTKARAIYKQVVENRTKEQTDRSSPAFKTYLQAGRVSAILGGQKSYHSIGSAYYVENRTYCQEVINHFPVLDLDKRVGKDKVKAILGVRPLEDVLFKLRGDPQLHPLNSEFQQDFEGFKPYVYALRVVKDSKHTQLSNLKQSKITLCFHIEASYLHDGLETDFKVRSYEHVFIGKSNNVYLTVDKDLHSTLFDLREDIRFCDAVGEIVSGILKVEENRETIGNLYSRNETQRKDILRGKLDDDKLYYLEQSNTLLGVITDPQQNFWRCVFKAARPLSTFPELETDDALKLFLQKTFGLEGSYVAKIFGGLDYDDINSRDSLELVIDLFKWIGIDVALFNQQTVRTLDLTDHYTTRLNGLMDSYQEKYESYLYARLTGELSESKKRFVSEKLRYESFEEYKIINSVLFNVEVYFKDLLKMSFGVDFDDIRGQEVINLTDVFNKQRAIFVKSMTEQHGVTEGQIEMFLNLDANRSLLYFGETSTLEAAFMKKYGDGGTTTIKNIPKSIMFCGKQVTYESFEKLSASVADEIRGNDFQIIDITPLAADVDQQKKRGRRRSPGHRRPDPKSMEEIGFVGECMVYNLLQKKFGDTAVVWVSENARKAGINENGSESYHYDIRYSERSGRNVYVEVKTSNSDDLVFHISPDEVFFGEASKEDYEIYFVYGLADAGTKILRMRQFFKYRKGESFSKNSKFTVENDSFTVRFTSD